MPSMTDTWTTAYLPFDHPDRPVAVLLRHAEREAIIDGAAGHEVNLTDAGALAARALGRALGPRLRRITSSPIKRCEQTALGVAAGAGGQIRTVFDRLLGDPGAFVADGDAAWVNWQRLGNAGVIEHLALSDEPLPGMHATNDAARRLAALLSAVLECESGTYVFVTHDTVLAPFVARALRLREVLWPDYLDAALLWKEGGNIRLAFGGRVGPVMLAVGA